MSIYTKVVSGLLFPLHERLKGHTTSQAFRSLEASQWLSPVELEQLQVSNLQQFLLKIGHTVPYYRELFQSTGFDPLSVQRVQDLQLLPLLDKPEIRAHSEHMKAEGATQLQLFNTGGSTGEPLIFYLGNERVSHDVAAKRRATRWWGVDIGDREIVVWGSPIELGAQDRLRLIRDRLFRSELLSAFEMSDQNMRQFARRIQKFRPRMLFGYPSSLALLGELAKKNGIELNTLGTRVVFVTSERLYDHQRQSIESAFGCPVANGYGGRDAGFIAHQCPKGSLHLTAEDIVVEIIDDNGEVVPDGQQGEIVVTHMRTSEFPFVRYRTGDVGAIGQTDCACGRGLPVLTELEGRATDFVTAADGTVLHGLSLIYVLRAMPEIKAFKIVQEDIDKMTVQIVTESRDREAIESKVNDQFRQRLGGSLVIDFSYAEEIGREASGKFRYVVSKL